MFAPLTSCSPDRAECKSITCQGPKEWGHLDGSVFYSWAAPVEWAVLSASTSQMEFNLGSIHCPDCWPLITSKVRRGCWISAGGFMLKGSKRLSGSTEIHHQTLETGQRLLAGRSVWTEEDASGAFIRQRRCGVWLRCGSNMLNVWYQVKSVLCRKPQFNQKKWSYDGDDGRYDDSWFAFDVTSLRCGGVKCRRRAGSDFLQQRQSDKASLCWCFALFMAAQIDSNEKLTGVFIECPRLLATEGNNASSWVENAGEKKGSPSFICGGEDHVVALFM